MEAHNIKEIDSISVLSRQKETKRLALGSDTDLLTLVKVCNDDFSRFFEARLLLNSRKKSLQKN